MNTAQLIEQTYFKYNKDGAKTIKLRPKKTLILNKKVQKHKAKTQEKHHTKT